MAPFTYVPHAIGTSLVGIIFWLGKKFGSHLAKTVTDAESKLTKIHEVVTVQAENHLCTIQANTGETNKVLGDIRVQMAEQNGYLRALVEKK